MKQRLTKTVTAFSLGAVMLAGLPATAQAKEAPTFETPTLSSATITQALSAKKTPVKLNLTVNGPVAPGDVYTMSQYAVGAASGTGPYLYSPSECNVHSDFAKTSKCKGTAKSWGSIYGNSSSTISVKMDYSKPVPLQTMGVEVTNSYKLYPGKYKVVVPVNKLKAGSKPGQLVGGTQKQAVGYLTVNADAATSKKMTKVTVAGSWEKNLRYRPTVTATAPNYQAGAKATFYFKAAGAKTYSNVGSATTSRHGTAVLTPAQSKNLAKGGSVYVTFDGVKFSPKFSSNAVSFTKKKVVLW